jgi:hypothetical protein
MFKLQSPNNFLNQSNYCTTLKNWMPLSLLDFNSNISKFFNIGVLQDHHLNRDMEFFKEWKGNSSITKWCVLKNGKAIGITNDNKIISKNILSLWKRIILTFRKI